MFEAQQRSEFNKWFDKYSYPAAIITVFSSVDIELLHILDSKFGGYKIFLAPYSQFALKSIFWGRCLNIITEELPQLIIQVIIIISK
jgi:hypothetical protein